MEQAASITGGWDCLITEALPHYALFPELPDVAVTMLPMFPAPPLRAAALPLLRPEAGLLQADRRQVSLPAKEILPIPVLPVRPLSPEPIRPTGLSVRAIALLSVLPHRLLPAIALLRVQEPFGVRPVPLPHRRATRPAIPGPGHRLLGLL